MFAALDDAVIEVRAAAVSVIGMGWDRLEPPIGPARLRSRLCAVLEDADNAPVLYPMLGALSAMLSGPPADCDLVASALNGLAAQRFRPMFTNMRSDLHWVLGPAAGPDGMAAHRWLERAPFDGGAGLVEHLSAVFGNVAAPASERATALAALDRLGSPVQDHAVLEFLLRDPQDGASLDAVRHGYQFWENVFHLRTARAPDRVERLRRLMARSRALSADQTRRSVDYRRKACASAVEYALSGCGDQGEAQRLMQAVFDSVAADAPEVAAGLAPLEDARTALDLSGLQAVVETARDACTARRIAVLMAQRYATTMDPAMLQGIERILVAAPAPMLAADLVSKLPMQCELSDRPAELARLCAAVGRAAEHSARVAPESDPEYDRRVTQRIRDWLA